MFIFDMRDKMMKAVREAAEQKNAQQNDAEAKKQATEAVKQGVQEMYNTPAENVQESQDVSTIYDNIVKEDKEFSEGAFKAKVDNIFIQLYTAVMKQDLQKVKHFLADDVYAKYQARVEQLQQSNQLQIYDELNVSDTNITSVIENEDNYEIHVNLLTKYLDYIIAKDTKAFLHGNKDVRVERRINLVFTKTKQAKELKAARTCPNCGANLDLNKTGVCSYCGSIFKLEEYDWVLKQIND